MAEADKVVVEIEARVDQANRNLQRHAEIAESSMGRVEHSALKAEAAIRRAAGVKFDPMTLTFKRVGEEAEKVSGRIANAQRNLGRQIADVGSSLASGSSPFMVLAQQAPQVADALTDMGGKAGKVAAFFSGPWGAALLAAGSVVGVLASSLLSSDDAAKQHEKSAKSLADAIRDMTPLPLAAVARSPRPTPATTPAGHPMASPAVAESSPGRRGRSRPTECGPGADASQLLAREVV